MSGGVPTEAREEAIEAAARTIGLIWGTDADTKEDARHVVAVVWPLARREALKEAITAIRAIPRRSGTPEWSKHSYISQAAGFDVGLACAADAVAAVRLLVEEAEK